MAKYEWNEYYEKFFYDWSESTRANRLSSLVSLGPANEVAEVIEELDADGNESAANRLLKRAIAEKLVFSINDICRLLYSSCDYLLLEELVYASAKNFKAKDMEELYSCYYFEDDIIMDICDQYDIPFPKELLKELREEKRKEIELLNKNKKATKSESPKKSGFWATLFSLLFGSGGEKTYTSSSPYDIPHEHGGKCDGDCENCPPHYGYRYGRWYYGKSHSYGCEFGGNKGDGAL
ncbi:MAG: hypothetical protein GYA87_03185 [Christensenellaceae bacterium]|nr:hypothetical protein [Christensenellaceae bacterium]